MDKNDIMIFGLLGFGLYLICSVNNENDHVIKNTGTLEVQKLNSDVELDKLQKLTNLNTYDSKTNVNPLNSISDSNEKFASNYTLGVDINDPLNIKYKQQAPNYDNNKLTVTDLLPGDVNDQWDFGVPIQKVSLNDANLLGSATSKIGFNTQGNTLKNASTDLRGNIPNPKIQVGPFNNSSYEPDNNMKSWYV